MTARNQPGIVITTPTPALSGGKPMVPSYWAIVPAIVTAILGPTAIHSAPPPAPLPSHDGYYYPPAPVAGAFSARWSVEYLPDPASYAQGFYWLGDPSTQDGTASIQAGARQWKADGGAANIPAWRSFFPYKPSVTSVTHYLFGGAQVHHPKGVNFNANFVEHMWMNFQLDHRQPFTWVIAAMVTSFPSTNYTHYLLDSGRNPDQVGFPRLTDTQLHGDRKINDDTGVYRQMLAISPNYISMCTRMDQNAGGTIRAKIDANLRPKMFVGVFNGTTSYTGAYSPGRRALTKGHVDDNHFYHHRYYVMGRKHGLISPGYASHLLVFEIRYWDKALNTKQLSEQYDQLSSRHQFNSYRGL